ncbi:GntR family transcriptional regulator [Eubacterium sp. 1001713B170207_170306_E7]|uniref:GntR family transcriptional regulator n=1 Tax=Eubacterium sp. 1001713B170207_170306_E7 TaxID=2787097 RepID=UPI00189B977C|nr:GntR family transcriptional regulator [Eubacterium sp. 1001713B170207_170306_E7]
MEQPLYRKLVNDIKHKIQTQVYRPGDKLPSEITLMADYQVSKSTLRKALKTLCDESYLKNVYRVGYFISRPEKNDYLLHFDEVDYDIRFNERKLLSQTFVSMAESPAPWAFNCEYLYFSSGIPAAFQCSSFFLRKKPRHAPSESNNQRIVKLFADSVFLHNVEKKLYIEGRRAPAFITSHLRLPQNSILICTRHAYTNRKGSLIASSETWYRSTYFNFSANAK